MFKPGSKFGFQGGDVARSVADDGKWMVHRGLLVENRAM
jgi:hypothetical protein